VVEPLRRYALERDLAPSARGVEDQAVRTGRGQQLVVDQRLLEPIRDALEVRELCARRSCHPPPTSHLSPASHLSPPPTRVSCDEILGKVQCVYPIQAPEPAGFTSETTLRPYQGQSLVAADGLDAAAVGRG
jgi:hypothetical protein